MFFPNVHHQTSSFLGIRYRQPLQKYYNLMITQSFSLKIRENLSRGRERQRWGADFTQIRLKGNRKRTWKLFHVHPTVYTILAKEEQSIARGAKTHRQRERNLRLPLGAFERSNGAASHLWQLNLAELLLVFIDVLLQGHQKSLGMFGGHHHATYHLGFGYSG